MGLGLQLAIIYYTLNSYSVCFQFNKTIIHISATNVQSFFCATVNKAIEAIAPSMLCVVLLQSAPIVPVT